jgi:hypothetical protein
MICSRFSPLHYKRVARRSALLLLLSVMTIVCGASAQTVTRGPYLQLVTTSEISVRWRTSVATNSVVRYGTSLFDLTLAATNSAPTKEHEVRLTGLSAGTAYYYSVGTSSDVLATGNDYVFYTAPLEPKPIRIWAIGDAGTGNANQALVRDKYYTYFTGVKSGDAINHPLDVWLMLGDNAYPSGTDANYQKAVFNMYPELLRRTVVWPTFGNHDDKASGSASQSGPYYAMFTLPKNGEAGGVASGTEAYYSFDYGNVHFVCLNSSDIDRSTNGAMYAWLQNDLAAVTNEWLIAYWHHPPYTKGSHNSDTERELIQMRENVLPLLEEYGVDLVLCGHSHSYERSKFLDGHYGKSFTLVSPMVLDGGSGQEDDTGAYMKSTTGGQAHRGTAYVVAGASGKTSGGRLNHPAMHLSLNELGSLLIDINGNRMDVRYEGVRPDPFRQVRLLRDYFTVIKSPNPTNALPAIDIFSTYDTDSATLPIQSGSTNLAIRVIPSDPDGFVTNLVMRAGHRVIGTISGPVANGSENYFVWTNVPAGVHTFVAYATDDRGDSVASRAMTVRIPGPTRTTVVLQDGQDGYSGSSDTTIMADFPADNFGTDPEMEADGKPDRAILARWDLSAIPPGKTVVSATLSFTMFDRSGTTYEVYPLKRDWVESEATWTNATSSVPWSSPGAISAADRSFVPLGALKAQRDGTATLVMTNAAVAPIQQWINQPAGNFGFIILDYRPSDGLGVKSRETPIVAERPRLTVIYE